MTATRPVRSSAGVRRATRADLDAIVRTLVASHHGYTWERWMLPDESTRAATLEAIYRIDLDVVGLPHGDVWVSDDVTAVAVWTPVGIALDPDDQDRLTTVDDLLGERAGPIADVDRALRPPHGPVDWYLATMGTTPDLQGRGLGSAVLAPKLADLDRRGHVARLDTSDPGNVRFYERHGFSVIRHVTDLPHDAPATWTMERRPA